MDFKLKRVMLTSTIVSENIDSTNFNQTFLEIEQPFFKFQLVRFFILKELNTFRKQYSRSYICVNEESEM